MVPDQVVFILVQENIELACQAIEKAAMDRAVIDVDDGFAAAYEIRRRHREVSGTNATAAASSKRREQQHPGQPFWDSSIPQSNVFNSLPDTLRIKPSGVQNNQLKVYEEFSTSKFPFVSAGCSFSVDMDPKRRVFTSRPNSTVSYSRADQIASALYSPSPAPESGQSLLRPQEAMERFNVSRLRLLALLQFSVCSHHIRPW